MANTKQTAAFKREALKRSEKAKKGWVKRRAKQVENAMGDLNLAADNLDLKEEIKILTKSLESCENALFKKDNLAMELQSKKVDIMNKISVLEVELKETEKAIIDYKSNLNAELNILS